MAPWSCFRCGCERPEDAVKEYSPRHQSEAKGQDDWKQDALRIPPLPISKHSSSNHSALVASVPYPPHLPADSPHHSEAESSVPGWTEPDEFFTPRSHLSMASSLGSPTCLSPVRGGIQGIGGQLRQGDGQLGKGLDAEQVVVEVLRGAAARLSSSALAHELQELVDQGRYSDAHTCMTDVCSDRGVTVEELATELESEAFDVKDLLRLQNQVQKALSVIHSDVGWHIVLETKGLQISHKQKPGTHIHSFRSKATLDCPVQHVLCLAREFDLLPSWIKYIPESSILKEMSPRELLVYFVQWMPWPVSSKDFLVTALVADLLDTHGCLCVPTHSTDCPADVQMPAGAAHRSRIVVQPGSGFTVKPLQPEQPGGTQRCQVTMVYQLDAGVPIPNFILEFVMKVFGPFIYHQACRIVLDQFRPGSGSPYVQRLEQHSDVYKVVETRCDEFLRMEQKEQSQAPQ